MAINLLTDAWSNIENLFDRSTGSGWSSSLDGTEYGGTYKPSAVALAKRTSTVLTTAGLITQGVGAVTSAVASYYAAESSQYQLKSQASNYRFQADMARMNASAAERDAQSTLESGKSQVASYTMQAGQEKAGATATMAARGVAVGVGSTADISASQDIVKDINVLNINSNAVRSAAAQRMQGAGDRGVADIYDTSANNALLSAKTISPLGNMTASLLGSASQVASEWDWRRQMRNWGFGGN